MQMYIDTGCGSRHVEVNEAEVAALSDVCKHCKGLCCTHFSMSLIHSVLSDGTKIVDWWEQTLGIRLKKEAEAGPVGVDLAPVCESLAEEIV